jgi:hypothetical protein
MTTVMNRLGEATVDASAGEAATTVSSMPVMSDSGVPW